MRDCNYCFNEGTLINANYERVQCPACRAPSKKNKFNSEDLIAIAVRAIEEFEKKFGITGERKKESA